MITLSITLPDSSTHSKSAGNTTGAAVLNAVADEIGATGTNSDKADAIVAYLARHLANVAIAHQRKVRAADADVLAQEDASGLQWS